MSYHARKETDSLNKPEVEPDGYRVFLRLKGQDLENYREVMEMLMKRMGIKLSNPQAMSLIFREALAAEKARQSA